MKAIRTFNADEAPPAYEENLTCSGIYVEHGNPVLLHLGMETKPQGEAIAVRAKESGKSECHPVMGWIGVARFSDRNIIPLEKVADVQMVLNDEKLTTPV